MYTFPFPEKRKKETEGKCFLNPRTIHPGTTEQPISFPEPIPRLFRDCSSFLTINFNYSGLKNSERTATILKYLQVVILAIKMY